MFGRPTSTEHRGGGTFAQARAEYHHARTRTVFRLLGLAAIVGWAYVLFMSDLFTINEIQASGLKELDPVEVNREVFQILDSRKEWRPWSPRHAWFINTEALAQQLKDRLFASNVIVDKSYTNVLRLSVEERSKRLIFHSHQQYFWVDLQGIATNELTDDERKLTQQRILGTRIPAPDDPPVIHRDLDELISPGYVVADSNQVKFWIQTATEIARQGLAYREMQPPNGTSSTTAILTSPEGYKILIDAYTALEPQLKTYQ